MKDSELQDEGDSVLDPVNRSTEVLFGLIMVLTFTCSMSAISPGRSDVREMLIGALGCNLAWGIIDGFFYLINVAVEHGRERVLIQRLKDTPDQPGARRLLESIIPESVAGSLTPGSFLEIREHLLKSQDTKSRPLISFSELKAALLIFGLVFLSTFPVAIPFLIFSDVQPALRVSNAIALFLLFALGFSLGRYAGLRPINWGVGMALIGSVLVSITITLGG